MLIPKVVKPVKLKGFSHKGDLIDYFHVNTKHQVFSIHAVHMWGLKSHWLPKVPLAPYSVRGLYIQFLNISHRRD